MRFSAFHAYSPEPEKDSRPTISAAPLPPITPTSSSLDGASLGLISPSSTISFPSTPPRSALTFLAKLRELIPPSDDKHLHVCTFRVPFGRRDRREYVAPYPSSRDVREKLKAKRRARAAL